MKKLLPFFCFAVKEECCVALPVCFEQHSFASGRKVTTTEFMKGAKQPQAFPEESPEKAAQKGSQSSAAPADELCQQKFISTRTLHCLYILEHYYMHSNKPSSCKRGISQGN